MKTKDKFSDIFCSNIDPSKILKALLVLKIFKFLCRLIGHIEKGLDQKDKFNFKIYDVTTWLANNNTHIAHYLKNKDNQTIKFSQLMEYNKTIFL